MLRWGLFRLPHDSSPVGDLIGVFARRPICPKPLIVPMKAEWRAIISAVYRSEEKNVRWKQCVLRRKIGGPVLKFESRYDKTKDNTVATERFTKQVELWVAPDTHVTSSIEKRQRDISTRIIPLIDSSTIHHEDRYCCLSCCLGCRLLPGEIFARGLFRRSQCRVLVGEEMLPGWTNSRRLPLGNRGEDFCTHSLSF